ncbi:aspartate carbamoyltransferase regulatory subunit [Candidatus Sulfidibacterium hydrothermale]|uniref:aspartate carbamoyltransferase regulatory subunit n=1 Tax=Candidatus Sulfidibacterium hydrothermale TaxID=2875962 RepID=UPI001F0AB392|nr:aspartate carbamoyltransferase regulatory subunit [Candidatus Sulfidibacterium hydrothermale]UBM63464.1 aspartate carbamoyltransferase regulatory subunit [Candidatus Sulfidibacterium hydrothermale]
MKNKRTELKVQAIRTGTVIDHIQAENTYRVFTMLNLEKSTDHVYFGTNLESKKLGKKGIIKISNKFFEPEEISKIALVAPHATLIEIRDYEIIKKQQVELPREVHNIVKCVNPKCVTNNQEVPTQFKIIRDHHGKLKLLCRYCEKTMSMSDVQFL